MRNLCNKCQKIFIYAYTYIYICISSVYTFCCIDIQGLGYTRKRQGIATSVMFNMYIQAFRHKFRQVPKHPRCTSRGQEAQSRNCKPKQHAVHASQSRRPHAWLHARDCIQTQRRDGDWCRCFSHKLLKPIMRALCLQTGGGGAARPTPRVFLSRASLPQSR